jgi:hypothetical protein
MRRPAFLILTAAMIAITWAGPSNAADPRYPDWPCAQAKVPELSVAAAWDGPSIDAVGETWKDDPNIKDLVAKLAARRTPIEEAQKAAVEFVMSGGADKAEKAKTLFAGIFEALNRQRVEIIDGIDRLAQKEKELAGKIRSDRAALSELQDRPDADKQRLDELTNQLEWNTRIFEDRRKTIRYVCEAPIVIERRLFTLGRAIQQAVE